MRKETAALYEPISGFSKIISQVLKTAVIPLLPLYICGTFVNMTVSGETIVILNILWKVFLAVIILHLICFFILFLIAGSISKKNPFVLIKNQIPGYLSAIGTQSSAATIPVNLKCAEADGVSAEIRNFVIPLCANIHMAGSMITITCCVTVVLLMHQMPISLGVIVPFIMTLGVAMVASPGAPGGSIMTALPFLPIVGIASDGAIASLLIALYITQDSFGTACNVSGDNAISVIVDTFYQKYIKKSGAAKAA
jgi:Na+/H+-dicarboxylate symporter